ncbi:NAD(P)H dehydrogenase (quinone) [Pseudonocardia oroxyli]|uniref:NAD(P)H dehydrogenase (Quinone) n=2 Tax=Pseudonocardia oroxyli TaxID=366584 RepID=A0A1G8BL37_PSEOR|nr:NAD(P)H dehydrogenase (quinone) [Pseudonocardia oroxyli]
MLSVRPLSGVDGVRRIDDMDVLWVVAPPDPQSLTATLAARGVAALRSSGHAVEVSDLPAMGWDPVVTAADYGVSDRLFVSEAAGAAYAAGTLPADVRAEQDKIRRAELLVLHFPLWWFGMPAILKGWVDRVFVSGFGYGVRGPDGRTRRYGDGILAGKRALVVTSAGGPAAAFGPRGVNGELEEVLFPILHGTLFYAGATVLAPHLVAGADRYSAADADAAGDALVARLAGVASDPPIPYRPERQDYAALELHPHVAPGETGLRAHRAAEARALSA